MKKNSANNLKDEWFWLGRRKERKSWEAKIKSLEHHHCSKCELCGKELGLVYSKEEINKICSNNSPQELKGIVNNDDTAQEDTLRRKENLK